ncbi:MAG: GNAT family N-acetyltransferase [Bacteroidia bacterium]|jgi:hypothetical protein
MEFKIQHIDLYWEGWKGDDQICGFEYFRDDAGIWINNIWTYGDHQRRGYGTRMIEAAVKKYGVVLVSTASRLELNSKMIHGDSRYEAFDNNLTPFIESCIQKGILKEDWRRNPYTGLK